MVEKLLLCLLWSCGIQCKSCWLSEPGQMTAVTVRALDMWTSPFQGETGDLFLLLGVPQNGEKGKCSPAHSGSGKDLVITLTCAG